MNHRTFADAHPRRPVKKRRKSRAQRGPIKHTVIEPKWIRGGRRAMKIVRRVAVQALAWAGAITLVFLLIHYLGGGG